MEQATGATGDATIREGLVMKTEPAVRVGAFTFVDLLVILAALVVITFLVLPVIAKRHARSSKISCTNHLKQIGLAYRQWSIDNGDKFPTAVSTTGGGAKESVEAGAVYTSFLVMSNELNTPRILVCPEARSIVPAATFGFPRPPGVVSTWIPLTNNNSITYFVGLDANETKPDTILSGDDNFLVNGVKPKSGVLLLWTNSPVAWTKDRHVKQGNIGLADGSVLGTSTAKLAEVLVKAGAATNRLAMP